MHNVRYVSNEKRWVLQIVANDFYECLKEQIKCKVEREVSAILCGSYSVSIMQRKFVILKGTVICNVT